MLYNSKQFSQDQLLTDLLALKEKLSSPDKWVKGTFNRGGSACLIAACEMITDHEIGFIPLRGELSERDLRLGRLVVALYVAIYGPKAPTNILISTAMSRIAEFNDNSRVDHATVMLALDEAIKFILEPAEVPA